ncbi:MAG: hypothetical protein FWD47_08190 [Treponema sp.]|nr:hypothetical protein [Treponema sp.]
MKKAFFVILFPIIMFSCDVFVEPFNPDYLDDLYKEIAWANAPRLSVRIEYESAWGTSNPSRGPITPAMDIRHGYPFTIEFTPDPPYILIEWLAYVTSSLPANWIDDNTLLNDAILLGPQDVILPEVNSTGGSFDFIINTSEPVTIIPWCKREPRITRTEPRNNPNQTVSRASDIIIYFNGYLNQNTVKFASNENEDGIWITAQDLSPGGTVTNINSNYNNPVYSTSGGNFTVTMSPSNIFPPANSLITVKIQGIENIFGEPMSDIYSFSWLTPESAASAVINSWEASYNFNTNNIKIDWDTTGADRLVMYYRINKGANTPLLNESSPDPAGNISITGIPRINDSGVLQGIKTSNVYEYEIFIELFIDNIREDYAAFRIWNIPGMTVNQTNTVYLNQANFAATEGLAAGGFENYILTEDITLSNWTPPSNFTGKLYGNGHTITINNFSSSTNIGLLGVADDALVRDLHIEYPNTSITGSTNFGGITGEMRGTSRIENSIVSGAINGSATNIGGIVGSLTNGTIENSYSSVNINYTRSGNSDNPIRIGGFVGYSTNSTLINCGSRNLIMVNRSGGSLLSSFIIGGFAGEIQSNITRCYSTTSIEVFIDIADETTIDRMHAFGGFSGRAQGSYKISECYATGSITIGSIKSENFNYRVGGFVGFVSHGFTFEDCYSTSSISVDRVNAGNSSNLNNGFSDIGGFAGYLERGSNKIIRCFTTGSYMLTVGGINIGSAGGIASYVFGRNQQNSLGYTISNNEIRSCMVLGSYISGIDINDRFNAGRIWINTDLESGIISVQNYGINTFLHYRLNPYNLLDSRPVHWGTNIWDGVEINRVSINAIFYRNTLGYSDTIWDLGSPVTRNGWPTLRNVSGPQ